MRRGRTGAARWSQGTERPRAAVKSAYQSSRESVMSAAAHAAAIRSGFVVPTTGWIPAG